jgi:ribosomal protein L7/L12
MVIGPGACETGSMVLKIQAIKLMRELHGIGLKEAKDWVDAAARGL